MTIFADEGERGRSLLGDGECGATAATPSSRIAGASCPDPEAPNATALPRLPEPLPQTSMAHILVAYSSSNWQGRLAKVARGFCFSDRQVSTNEFIGPHATVCTLRS